MSSTKSLLHHSKDSAVPVVDTNEVQQTMPSKSYKTLLKIVAGSVVGNQQYNILYDDVDDAAKLQKKKKQKTKLPTLESVARKVAEEEGTILDDKQQITYEIICCTFLLGLIYDGYDHHTDLGKSLTGNDYDPDDWKRRQKIIRLLEARGGNSQLIMFLTGPAGAGKSTAVKVAERFCFEICNYVQCLWGDSTFLFTAYTGSAASAFNGKTICTVAHLNTDRPLTDEEIQEWKSVRILVIDEISFMSDKELRYLDKRLRDVRDRNKVFGGFSIIFAGDFRQLSPGMRDHTQVLYSRSSSKLWENSINVVMILDNTHRFKNDPKLGKILKRFWLTDLSKKARRFLNSTRIVGHNGLKLPESLGDNGVYACPTNKERNAISAGIMRQHILDTHPSITSNLDPPAHTIIVEAFISSAIKGGMKKKINNVLRHRIVTTCGDAHVKHGYKCVDPALAIYVGAYVMCVIDNKSLEEKVPRGNGTLCRVTSLKLKDNARSHKWKNYYNRKVWTVCATDVEWIECEHVVKTATILKLEAHLGKLAKKLKTATTKKKRRKLLKQIKTTKKRLQSQSVLRRFKLEPETNSCAVSVKPHALSPRKEDYACLVTQLPLNLNDATTGHKLQGMSKDIVIITSWPNFGDNPIFKNWEYTVLSRARSLEGLFLFQPIDMNKSFQPSQELKDYFKRAKRLQNRVLKKRKQALEELNKTST